jgi:hypothetical protein
MSPTPAPLPHLLRKRELPVNSPQTHILLRNILIEYDFLLLKLMTEKCMTKFCVMDFKAQCCTIDKESSICLSIDKWSFQVP